MLALARLVLAFVPFKRAIQVAGLRKVDGAQTEATHPLQTDQAVMATDVGCAITRVAPHLPFRAVCLQQAIACTFMLGRRKVPMVVNFGVACGLERPLEAHAWTVSGGTVLTGALGRERFTLIATFSRGKMLSP